MLRKTQYILREAGEGWQVSLDKSPRKSSSPKVWKEAQAIAKAFDEEIVFWVSESSRKTSLS